MAKNKNVQKYRANARLIREKAGRRIPMALQKRFRAIHRELWRNSAYRSALPTEAAVDGWQILEQVREEGRSVDLEGNWKETPCLITTGEGEELHRIALDLKPKFTVEVGLAMGISTLYLLQAIAKKKCGRLLSMDPFQRSPGFGGVGLMNIRRAGLDGFHLFTERPSQLALPGLLEQGVSADLAFVDGNHLFDYTLLEFFYLDKLLRKDGWIVFHDYRFPSVRACLNFVEANFDYEVIATDEKNLRILRKRSHDERPWWHSIPFEVPQITWTEKEDRELCD